MGAGAKQFRAWLVLGRVSNLPTVWSNCLAAWLLGGGGAWGRFALLGAGATLLYLGGMFLNDAFDEEFDRAHRRTRPIPAGLVAARTVWLCGWSLLGAGLLALCLLGQAVVMLAALLAGTIVVYDAIHKRIAFAPALMAECRFLLYLVAASAANAGVSGLAMWSALVLALYVAGLSFVARGEGLGQAVSRWWAVLLAAPVVLALIANSGPLRQDAVLLAVVLAAWTARSLRPLWWAQPPDIGRAVSGLLAGIVWVDWLAVADQGREFGFVFIGLFLLARAAQRFVPAT